ncbi:unnamed protein product [Chrysodeixis includens]|uniref:Fucosyltransferase n=1 Tax=Chrysodeixis includens TaxID=689277 RepID=A0A9N8PY36_CHRIL|nr:unnamed protein product [Chrysodeixis includens]
MSNVLHMEQQSATMCKRIKQNLWTVLFCALKMLYRLVKRVLRVTLCELLWFILVFVIFIVLWTVSDVKDTSAKVTAQYPVILWWTMEFPGSSSTRTCSNNIKCYVYSDREKNNYYNIGAYLFYASNINFKNLPLPRKPKDVIWGLYHEESPRNVEELLHEKALSLFNFTATFSRFSNIPFPLQHLHAFEDITSTTYFVETSVKNTYLKDISPIMYLQSDCETSTERDAYVQELMKLVDVDSYGTCLNNRELPSKFKTDYLNNLNEAEFLKFIARYKFVVAIENGACNDYITEKFWRAIKVGTIPIYFGSPTIRDWLPNPKSAILLEDFPTPKMLYKHIEQLLNNDTLYEEYLEHKTIQTISNDRLVNEYRDRPYQLDGIKVIEKFECFICERLHEKMNDRIEVNIVNKSHYDCPKPISALTLKVNPDNSWVYSWESAETNAAKIYTEIMDGD